MPVSPGFYMRATLAFNGFNYMCVNVSQKLFKILNDLISQIQMIQNCTNVNELFNDKYSHQIETCQTD